MSSTPLAVRKLITGDALAEPATPGAELGSLHLLTVPVGPLSAGNDFNWWNLLIVNPGQEVQFDRPGCYGIYVAKGTGQVTFQLVYHQANSAVDEVEVVAVVDISEFASEEKRSLNRPGNFTLKIRNTAGEVGIPGSIQGPLVLFLLLAIDPGTTPPPDKRFP